MNNETSPPNGAMPRQGWLKRHVELLEIRFTHVSASVIHHFIVGFSSSVLQIFRQVPKLLALVFDTTESLRQFSAAKHFCPALIGFSVTVAIC